MVLFGYVMMASFYQLSYKYYIVTKFINLLKTDNSSLLQLNDSAINQSYCLSLWSVERLYNQLVESGQPALEPLMITNSGGKLMLILQQMWG